MRFKRDPLVIKLKNC
jgi:hypothetical protein